MPDGNHFETELSGAVAVIRVLPDAIQWLRGLADARPQAFQEELTALLDAAPGPVVLDLGRAPFLNSDGIAVLIRLHHQLHAKGTRFGVRAGGEIVRVFELTKLAKLFPCGADLPTVIAQVSGG